MTFMGCYDEFFFKLYRRFNDLLSHTQPTFSLAGCALRTISNQCP